MARPAPRLAARTGGLSRPLAALLLALLALAGCAGEPAPTVVELTLAADPGLNPSPDGQPAPAVVRLYRLAGPAQFELADFFQLTDDPAGLLKADLVGMQELVIAPGETRTLEIPFEDNARVLGVTVAYRAIDQATWRAVAEVPAHETTAIQARILPLSIEMGG